MTPVVCLLKDLGFGWGVGDRGGKFFANIITNLQKGKGTGFFGGTTNQDKKFSKSVKNAPRPT